MSIKLEVGKSYLRRDGSGPWTIIMDANGSLMAISPNNFFGWWYNSDGQHAGSNRCRDLIAEWSEPPTLTTADFPICRALSATVPKPEPRRFVRWVNHYRNAGVSAVHETRKNADRAAMNSNCNRIACVRIEILKGQFDEPQPGDLV